MKQLNSVKESIKITYKVAPVSASFWVISTFIFSLLSPLYSIINKYLFDSMQKMVGTGWTFLQVKTVLALIFLFFLYNLLTFLLLRFSEFSNIVTLTKVNAYLQKTIMSGLKNTSYEKYEDNDFYNTLQELQREVNGGKILQIHSLLVSMLSWVITLGIMIFILIKFSVLAAIISVLCCIPGFLHHYKYGKANWEFNTSKIPLMRKTNYFFKLLTSLGTFKENIIFDTSDLYKKKYDDCFEKYYNDITKFNTGQCCRGILMATIHSLGTAGVIAWSYISAAKNLITLGDAVMYVGISQIIYNYIQNLIHSFGAFVEAKNMIQSTLNFISENNHNINNKRQKDSLQKHSVSIDIRNIKYKYQKTEKYVLDDICFSISPYQKIAIVGENGSGKTTLAKVILGLYAVNTGGVYINNNNINTFDSCSSYSSACFQDYFTYSFTVRENIAFGDINKIDNDAMIIKAAKESGFAYNNESDNNILDQFISRDFSKDGIVLSGGQSQKLSLARAFIKETGLLILDEPSASLDIITENEIFEKTLNLMKNKTVIIITHRLANVITSDKIIFLKNGKVVEIGTHYDLIKKNGEYAELFRIQASKYIDGKRYNQ